MDFYLYLYLEFWYSENSLEFEERNSLSAKLASTIYLANQRQLLRITS